MLQLSVEVVQRSHSFLPTWELQKLLGPRGGLEDSGLRGPQGQPWGHGRNFSGQSWSRGQLITLGSIPMALPSPPSWCTNLEVSAREVLPLQEGHWMGEGSACSLGVPKEAVGMGQRILSLCGSQKLQPLRFPRVLIVSCTPCQA